MSGARRLLQNSAAMVALAVIQRGAGLISMFVLARMLDARGLGSYTFTQSIAQMSSNWSRLGLDAGTHVVLAGSDDKHRAEALVGQTFTVALILAGALGVTLVVLAGPIADLLFGALELTPYVYPAALLSAALTMFSVIYAVHAGLGAFPAYARATSLGSAFSIAFAIGGSLAHGSLGASWGLAIGQVATVLIVGRSMRQTLSAHNIALRLCWPGCAALETIKRGFPFYASTLVLLPAELAALSLLGRVGAVDALGHLRVAQTIMSAAAVLPVAISAPIITNMSKRYAAGQGHEFTCLQAKVVWVFALFVGIGLAAVWPVLVKLVFGKAFALASAEGVLAIMAFIPTMLLTVVQGALLARGRAALQFLCIGVLQSAALMVASVLLTTRYGLAGYFIAQALCYGLGAILTGVAVFRTVCPPVWAMALGILTLAFFTSLIVDVCLQSTLVIRLLAAALGATVTFCVAAIMVFSGAERVQIKNLLNRMRTLEKMSNGARFHDRSTAAGPQ